MSNTTVATATATTTTGSKRIKYGFTLNFPSKPFTVKSLTSTGNYPKYITAYKRVTKALADGIITIVGEKTPAKARRGAREVLYARADAKTTLVSVPLTQQRISKVVAGKSRDLISQVDKLNENLREALLKSNVDAVASDFC